MESIKILVIGGVLIGILFGIILQNTKFCMAAAVSNFVLMRDSRQIQVYITAVSIALIGTQILDASGMIALNNTPYLNNNITWLAAIIGGLCFGFGTMLAGGCVGRMVIRIGEGDIGSIIVLIMIGTAGTATLFGLLNPLHLTIIEKGSLTLANQTSSIAELMNIPSGFIVTLLVVISLLIIKFTHTTSTSRHHIYTGISLGLMVTLAWWVTGYLSISFESTHRPMALSFAGPIVNSAMIITTGSSLTDSAYFGIAVLIGTVIGSICSAIWNNAFHWVLPEKHHIQNLVVGGLLMGFGAMLAGGCNIGQGLTGISTLSIKSFIAMTAIFTGMRLGLSWLLATEDETESFIYRFAHKKRKRKQKYHS